MTLRQQNQAVTGFVKTELNGKYRFCITKCINSIIFKITLALEGYVYNTNTTRLGAKRLGGIHLIIFSPPMNYNHAIAITQIMIYPLYSCSLLLC